MRVLTPGRTGRFVAFLLLLSSGLLGNPLLIPPAPIPADEVLASFQEVTDTIGAAGRGFTYHQGVVSLHVQYETLPEELTTEERHLFLPNEGGHTYLFGTRLPQVRGVPPLVVNGSAKKLELSEAAEWMKGRKVLLFEGAGVSAAAGVHTIRSLWTELGIDPTQTIDSFTRTAMHQPERLVHKILQFIAAGRDANPTPAHYALKHLSSQLGCQIVSGNFDRLHERTGIQPYRLTDHDWQEELTEQDFKEIDLILCLGMSRDIDGFLSTYKQYNPHGRLLAIDLNQPNYLSEADGYLQGDLQNLLPQLVKEL